MEETVLNILQEKNQPRNWDELGPEMKPKKAGVLKNEPVYEFFHTLDDSLEVNPQSIAISVQPVKSFIPYHIHDYVEIIVPIVGECTVVTKNDELHLRQNDLIIIGNHTIHRVEPIKADSIVINLTLKDTAFTLNDYHFMYEDRVTKKVSSLLFSLLSNETQGENIYRLFRTHQETKIHRLVEDIIQEYYYPDAQSNQLIRLELLTLFARLIRSAANEQEVISGEEDGSVNLLSLLLYIEKNYAQITLEEMAQHFGFNPNYLSSYLKKHTGLTFIKLVHLQRVNVAAEYLTYTNAPIEQIALKVGYENPSYFYKMFRKNLKILPTEYREKYSFNTKKTD
ncbi:AraC family transcriptional regulator [Enterococcus raffinosus]|uniref:AraC family transcriptional regulator n=2 Tax=Enterococcus raffinosus TaxID=71452 RepID=UPI001C442B32|nr:AraC family transcriptional regulator [Enterococcus raffinosus]MDT2571979.1 AraC family transcriptional regulator [Enterococcus raffinosus]QXJ60957.1 helix-turn-helix domain-containing protein [Enterococcus raffinosus]